MLCCAYTGDTFVFIDAPQPAAVEPVLALTTVSHVDPSTTSVPSKAKASGGFIYRKPAARRFENRMEACLWEIKRLSTYHELARERQSNDRRRTCWFKCRRRRVQAW